MLSLECFAAVTDAALSLVTLKHYSCLKPAALNLKGNVFHSYSKAKINFMYLFILTCE